MNRKLYQTWADMKFRCTPGNRYHDRYAARGITLCAAWLHWPTFRDWAETNGWAVGLEIDRRDNDRGYEPGNCRFVTDLEQNRNRDLKIVAASNAITALKRHAKPFMCVETGEVFQTQIEASRRHKVDRKALRLALRGEYTQTGGLHWSYVEASMKTPMKRS